MHIMCRQDNIATSRDPRAMNIIRLCLYLSLLLSCWQYDYPAISYVSKEVSKAAF